MDIKAVQPHRYRSKKSPFKQGYYEPLFPEKYCGRMPIIYRSSWEYKVCKFLDESSSVIRWGSECIRIPYFSILDEKNHGYFPDFYFEYRVGDTIRKIIVEVKPKKDLAPPEKPKKETPKTLLNYQRAAQVYIKNMEKDYKINLGENGIMFENKKTNFNFSLLRSTLTKYPKWGYLKQWESVL